MADGIRVGVLVGVRVGVCVGVRVGVLVGVLVSVGVGVRVAVRVGVLVGVRVLVAVATANEAAEVFSTTANPIMENTSTSMTAKIERRFSNCISVSFLLPNETVEKPFVCKFRSKISHFGLKNRPNVVPGAKNMAYFVVFVPLCEDESLRRDFFDSFNGWFQRRAGELAEKSQRANPLSGLNPIGRGDSPRPSAANSVGQLLT